MAKKIKKKIPVQPKKELNTKDTKELLSFIKTEQKLKKAPKEKAISYKSTPSKRPEFTTWRRRNIDDWTCNDFIGLYLTKYIEIYEEEDPDFKRANSYKFGKERGMVKTCLETHFDGDKERLSEYIEYIAEWWVSKDAWVNSAMSFYSVFTTKGTFVKIFSSKGMFKKQMTRNDMDNYWSKSDAWDEFLEEESGK